jgi:hypothetical protein
MALAREIAWYAGAFPTTGADVWVHSIPESHDFETAPCPPATLCGGTSTFGGTSSSCSIDYLRLFRGSDRPRWLLPITAGWQF